MSRETTKCCGEDTQPWVIVKKKKKEQGSRIREGKGTVTSSRGNGLHWAFRITGLQTNRKKGGGDFENLMRRLSSLYIK